ncbi:hypothetical protein FQZ97_1092770 [compost metagenome]
MYFFFCLKDPLSLYYYPVGVGIAVTEKSPWPVGPAFSFGNYFGRLTAEAVAHHFIVEILMSRGVVKSLWSFQPYANGIEPGAFLICYIDF